MARPLRVEYPGAFYHVINRGNNQENIFKNDRDREKFLEYMQNRRLKRRIEKNKKAHSLNLRSCD